MAMGAVAAAMADGSEDRPPRRGGEGGRGESRSEGGVGDGDLEKKRARVWIEKRFGLVFAFLCWNSPGSDQLCAWVGLH